MKSNYVRSNEPIVWSLFGAGGMVAAFLLPAVVLMLGVATPLGWVSADVISYHNVMLFASSWLGKLLLMVVICLPLYHAAHRIHHGLVDLHLHLPHTLSLLIFYGGSTLVTLAVGYWLLLI
ncbi:fumarate reductase subunit FrdD [Aestuariirhabdus litorea]|uniref:Fumarate reductase subunit D n=1 Tax=Aestuariirhabdus litorea TaxID=2528527 RepID=A0A3P3VMH1_9GAMM|nr:fumarate reductase subunit FrdD [Aestuariirhabdus litorea]RRJ83078.1 fumarate reductase subunit D [Aestuariirhabdus litorea]RWW93236.1 fumarate reductase subunit D [Endozoicomonadaceae bacterium GTF-13]